MSEYKLSYTAKEIDERLGLVSQNKENIDTMSENIDVINEALAEKADKEHKHNYAEVDHSHDNYSEIGHEHENYAEVDHTHDYAETNHAHDDYANKEHAHDNYANKDHAHDYAETDHNHDEEYDELGAANVALSESKTYTDNAVKAVKDDLLNGAGEQYDTLKELGELIDENHNALEALEEVATSKADKDHTHPGQEIIATEEPDGQPTGDYWTKPY
jgi:hypothetical protein